MTHYFPSLSFFHKVSSSLLSFFGIETSVSTIISHLLLNNHFSPNQRPDILILSQICVHFGIFTINFHSGCGTSTSPQRTKSNIVTLAFTYKSSHSRRYFLFGTMRILRYKSPSGASHIPASPFHEYLIKESSLIQAGILISITSLLSSSQPFQISFQPFLNIFQIHPHCLHAAEVCITPNGVWVCWLTFHLPLQFGQTSSVAHDTFFILV
jgi:hypothetical protein